MRRYEFTIIKESLNLEVSVILCTPRFDTECDHHYLIINDLDGSFSSIGEFATGEELIIASEGKEYPVIITGEVL